MADYKDPEGKYEARVAFWETVADEKSGVSVTAPVLTVATREGGDLDQWDANDDGPINLESLGAVLTHMGMVASELNREDSLEKLMTPEHLSQLRGAMAEWQETSWRWDDQFLREVQTVFARLKALVDEPKVDDFKWNEDFLKWMNILAIVMVNGRVRAPVQPKK